MHIVYCGWTRREAAARRYPLLWAARRRALRVDVMSGGIALARVIDLTVAMGRAARVAGARS